VLVQADHGKQVGSIMYVIIFAVVLCHAEGMRASIGSQATATSTRKLLPQTVVSRNIVGINALQIALVMLYQLSMGVLLLAFDCLLVVCPLQTFYSCFNGGTPGAVGIRRCQTFRLMAGAPITCPAQFLDFNFAFYGHNGELVR